jgi:hypothetical protein
MPRRVPAVQRATARRLRSNLALPLTGPSKIVALFAALTGHNLLKGSAAERAR